MTVPTGSSDKPRSQKALRQLVSDLAAKIPRLEQEVKRLRLGNSNLHVPNQALKDEIVRLKNLIAYLGDRLGLTPDQQRIPPLAILVSQAA